MTHSHAHSHHDGSAPLGPLAAKVVVGLLIAIGVVVVAGAAWLWPSRQTFDIPLPFQNAAGGSVTTETGLVVFMLPALCDGADAIPVALVASAVILYAVLYLAHGVNLRTSAALLGTLTSLLLAALLSWGAIKLTHLTGLSSERATRS